MTFSNSKKYRCTIDVRGYELDSFGHVNHAVYVSYLEHARWKMLEEENITLARFAEWQRWPVIISAELKYLKPSFMHDRLDILTEVIEHGRTHFTFAQSIHKGAELILKAQLQSVMVNEKGRPAAIPKEIYVLWTEGEAK